MKTEPTTPPPGAPGRMTARQGGALAAIILVGLLLRAAYLAEIMHTPEFTSPAVDPGFHNYWARGLATGDWSPPRGQTDPGIATSAFLRPPGYPYFLSLIYQIAGPGYLAPRIVNLALGLGNCLLVFIFARRWYGLSAGLIAAAFMSVYWVFIFFEGQLHEPAMLIFLLLSVVNLLGLWAARLKLRYCFAAGLLLGLSALVRPNCLVVLPVVVTWVCWSAYRRCRGRRLGAAGLALVLGAAMAIAPATIRNHLVADDFVLISANAGINLYLGNNERADGFFVGDVPGIGEFGTCYEYPAVVARLERELGKPLKYSEVSAHFTGRALAFMGQHPLGTLKLIAKKAFLFWGPREISHNSVIHYDREFSPVLSRIPGSFPLVLSLSLVGLALLVLDSRHKPGGQAPPVPLVAGQGRVSLLLALIILAYFLSYLPFFSAALYRVPITPFLIVFAAYGLYRLGRFARGRDVRRAGLWALVWLGLFALAGRPFVAYEADLGWWHSLRGAAYLRQGQMDLALGEFRESLRINPANPKVHYNLGTALAQLGRREPAIEALQTTLALEETNAKAHKNLAQLLSQAGRFDQAREHYRAAVHFSPQDPLMHGQLARVLATGQTKADPAERLAEALRHARRALELDPDQFDALLALGVALAETGRPAGAADALRRASALRPTDHEAHFRLGMAYHQQGDHTRAAQAFRQALRLQPGHVAAANKLAVSLGYLGDASGAVDVLRESLNHAPGTPNTLLNLARLLATSPDDSLRNGPEAVELTTQAVSRLGRHTPRSLFVLAAAQAASGRFEDAARTQRQAIDQARAAGQTDLAEEWRAVLARYEAKRPYHRGP